MDMVVVRSSLSRATFTVDPARITVLVVLLLPDGHTVLHLVDDVTAGQKSLVPMAGADSDPDGHFADRQITDPVYAGGVLDAKAMLRFGHDALALADGKLLEGL